MTIIEALQTLTTNTRDLSEIWAVRNGSGDFSRLSPAILAHPHSGQVPDTYSFVGSHPLVTAMKLAGNAPIDDQDAVIDYINESY
jgi:hypothetical protein